MEIWVIVVLVYIAYMFGALISGVIYHFDENSGDYLLSAMYLWPVWLVGLLVFWPVLLVCHFDSEEKHVID